MTMKTRGLYIDFKSTQQGFISRHLSYQRCFVFVLFFKEDARHKRKGLFLPAL